MIETIFDNSITISGPLLIERAYLESLDAALTENFERLKEYRKRKIDEGAAKDFELFLAENSADPDPPEQAEQERQRLRAAAETDGPFRRCHLSFAANIGHGKGIVAKSIKELLSVDDLEHSFIQRLQVDLRVADVRLEMDFVLRRDELTLRAGPESSLEARDLFNSIRHVSSELEAPMFLRFWRSVAPMHWIVLMMAATLLIPIYFGALLNSSKARLKEEAKTLLKDGISETEQREAIRVLLALEAGYSVDEDTSERARWPLIILGTIFCACLVYSFPPPSMIGVGAARKALPRWQWWVNKCAIGLPVFVVATVAGVLIDRVIG